VDYRVARAVWPSVNSPHRTIELRLRWNALRAGNDIAALNVRLHIGQPRLGKCYAQLRHGHPVLSGWHNATQQDDVGIHGI